MANKQELPAEFSSFETIEKVHEIINRFVDWKVPRFRFCCFSRVGSHFSSDFIAEHKADLIIMPDPDGSMQIRQYDSAQDVRSILGESLCNKLYAFKKREMNEVADKFIARFEKARTEIPPLKLITRVDIVGGLDLFHKALDQLDKQYEDAIVSLKKFKN